MPVKDVRDVITASSSGDKCLVFVRRESEAIPNSISLIYYKTIGWALVEGIFSLFPFGVSLRFIFLLISGKFIATML